MPAETQYRMVIERKIIDDLGIKMYDKVSAVIAELIANAYDADAENVIIKTPLGKALATMRESSLVQSGYQIEVEDDGHGMNPEEANEFFLRVGKHRREDPNQGATSRFKNRPVMGRKGIGKLASFGVCKTIEVRSAGGTRTANGYQVSHFELDYDRIIDETSEEDRDYLPPPLSEDGSWDQNCGTKIILKNFLSRRVPDKDTFLRQITYRFGLGTADFNIKVVDLKEPSEGEFEVSQADIPTMPHTRISVDSTPVELESGESLPIRGWIGMGTQSYKNEEFAGVRIYVRGKIASVTRDFGLPAGFTGEYVARSYLVGQIHVDWLDQDDDEDLIQTHRQDILWSSEKGRALQEWGHTLIKRVARLGREPRRIIVSQRFIQTSNLRELAHERFNDQELEQATLELGETIGKFAHEDELGDEEYVKGLAEIILTVAPHKLLVDAFKKIRDMAVDGQVDVNELVKLFQTTQIAQLASYGQIVTEKLNAIDLLENLIRTESTDELQLQNILEDSPWLIDPRWVPISKNQQLETFRGAFESWFEKKHKTSITTTTHISDKTKRPDFVFLDLEKALRIVEIKPPKHVFNDDDYKRMEVYFDSVSEYLRLNPKFQEYFPHGAKIILVRDNQNIGSTVEKAMQSLIDHNNLTLMRWEEMLAQSKEAHQSFLSAKESFGNI